MKFRVLFVVILMSAMLAMSVAYTTASFDGTTPPHAVDCDGKAIPESSATQPDKPFILAKDIGNNKDPQNQYAELKPEAAFDHAKHNSVKAHTLDGKTLTACVYCHHTEQPSASGGETYLKTFKRTAVLTAEQLETSKEPVKSCRACHFQSITPPTAGYPPKSVKYPRELWTKLGRESGPLTNDTAYHIRCINCHDLAKQRDPKLKGPTGCPECHRKKSETPTGTMPPMPCPAPAASPAPTVKSIQTPSLVDSTIAEAKVNSSQVQLLRHEGLSVQVRIETLKANLARIKPIPKRDELVAILRAVLNEALKAVERTEESFGRLGDEKSALAAGEIFFADLKASYRLALEDLVSPQAQLKKEVRFSAASFVDDPRYPALAQGTLRVLEQNVLAYNSVANDRDLFFDLDVTSVPAGATVFYKRKGDPEQKGAKPTNSTIPNLVKAIWFVRFQAPGYQDEVREHNPWNEPNHVLNVELQKK
jgi:hypothetical protein